MAIGILFILDAALPGGLVNGTGAPTYAQTMAFTTLTMLQLFNVLNARSDDRSAFHGMFTNRWLCDPVLISAAGLRYLRAVSAASFLDGKSNLF